MFESIHTRNQWASIPSAASVKKVKKRGANDGKKEFLKNFDRRYSGKEDETDELDPVEDDKKRKKVVQTSGNAKKNKADRKRDNKRGNKIDIRI